MIKEVLIRTSLGAFIFKSFSGKLQVSFNSIIIYTDIHMTIQLGCGFGFPLL